MLAATQNLAPTSLFILSTDDCTDKVQIIQVIIIIQNTLAVIALSVPEIFSAVHFETSDRIPTVDPVREKELNLFLEQYQTE